MLRSRFARLWLLWTSVYTLLAVCGPNGLMPTLVWPVVSQHVLQARAWLGQDIVIPSTAGKKAERIDVAPRLDVTPYFAHRVVNDPRENRLLSNLALALPDGEGGWRPAQGLWRSTSGADGQRELHCFVGFPPGPAFLLVPFALVFGSHLSTQWLSALLGGLAVALMDRLLPRWFDLLELGELALSRDLFALLAGAGTLWIWVVPDGGTFLFAQTVGVCALSGAVLLAAEQRPLAAGAAFGLAFTSRPAMLLALPLVVALLVLRPRRNLAAGRWTLLRFCIAPAALGGLTLLLNHLRFASPWDFGYRFMLVPSFLAERLAAHGQLSPAYLGHNLWTVLLKAPLAVRNAASELVFPWLASSPEGMGLVFVTPAFFALTAAWWIRGRRPAWILALSWSCLVLCCLPGLLYYNSGWVQWGGRFLLDAWPIWLMLAAIGLARFNPALTRLLVALSVLSNLWAALLTMLRIWPGCCS